MHPIIGIFGRMHAGKSTLAKIIRDTLTPQFNMYKDIGRAVNIPQIVGFADGIKDDLSTLLGIDRVAIDKYKNMPEFIPPGMIVNMRTAMQAYGENIRQIKPTAWIDRTMKLAESFPIIVDDGRHLPEFDSIKSKGGYCILIDGRHKGDGKEHSHISETSSDVIALSRKPDAWVHNNQSIDKLRSDVELTLVPDILKHFQG